MYSTNAIRIYSLLISIIITFVIQQSITKVKQISYNIQEQRIVQDEFYRTKQSKEEEQVNTVEQVLTLEETQQIQANKEIWQLMIPKIDLIASIQEGTDQSTMKKAIGHFERN